jgi:hypothetical protein
MLEVSVCILRPFQEDQMADEGFIYQRQEANGKRAIIRTVDFWIKNLRHKAKVRI